MEDAQPLTMMDAEGTVIQAAFSLEGSLSPEGEMDDPACGSDWSRTIAGDGIGGDNFLFNAFVLVEENPPRHQLLSVKEIRNLNNPTNDPQEVTQREDRGRWALLNTGIAAGQPTQDSQGQPFGGEGHLLGARRARFKRTNVPALWNEFHTAALRRPPDSLFRR